jgi:hypothetical protein
MRAYGASPTHLLVHLVTLPLAAWALLALLDVRRAGTVVAWLIGAILLHDLVLLPLYSALDRGARLATDRPRVRATNYVRVPVALSGLLLLVFWASISGAGDRTYAHVSGVAHEGYLGRWLLASAALFAASGLLYLLSLRRTGGSKA